MVDTGDDLPGVSVVIPARNEADNIEKLINSLCRLNYPQHKLEVVIVDDASEDGTAKKLASHTADINYIKWFTLTEPADFSGSFKKRALTSGIEASKFPIIVTSDADCQFGPFWIHYLVNALESNNWVMISGPVVYESTSPFSSMLDIEQACLMAVGAVSISRGIPNMCNGANLAFTRNSFYKVGGYAGFEQVVSGDDEFLLYKIHGQYPGRVGFLKNINSKVSTNPPVSWRELLNQRRRWGGKWKKHLSFSTRMLAIFVFGFHLLFSIVLLMTIFTWYSWKILALQLAAKFLVEYFLAKSVLRFLGKRLVLSWFFLMQLLYSFYVMLVGIGGQFTGFNWKNRQYR